MQFTIIWKGWGPEKESRNFTFLIAFITWWKWSTNVASFVRTNPVERWFWYWGLSSAYRPKGWKYDWYFFPAGASKTISISFFILFSSLLNCSMTTLGSLSWEAVKKKWSVIRTYYYSWNSSEVSKRKRNVPQVECTLSWMSIFSENHSKSEPNWIFLLQLNLKCKYF